MALSQKIPVKVAPFSLTRTKEQKRKTRFHTMKRILLLFRPYKGQMILVGLSILAGTALSLVVPLMIPLIFDDGLVHRNIGHLGLYAIIMVLAAFASGIIGVRQTYLNNLMGQQVMRDLRNKLYAHLQDLSLSFYTSMRSGEIHSRLSNDISGAQSTVTDTFTNVLTQVVSAIGTIAALYYLNPLLMLVSFVCLPFFLFLAVKVGKTRRTLTKATQQRLASLNVLIQETLSISGILLIKIFERKNFAQGQFEAENQKLTELSIHQQMLGRWFFMLINTFMILVPVIIAFAAGILLTYFPKSIHITLGGLFAFVTLQGRFFGSFNVLLTLMVEVQGSLALFDRVFEYLDQEVETKDGPGALHLSPDAARGEVSFKQVCFAYQAGETPDNSMSSLQNEE